MREIAHLAARPGEALMVFGTPFDCPGFAAAGAVGDEIQGDGVQHLIHQRGERFGPIPGPLSRVGELAHGVHGALG